MKIIKTNKKKIIKYKFSFTFTLTKVIIISLLLAFIEILFVWFLTVLLPDIK